MSGGRTLDPEPWVWPDTGARFSDTSNAHAVPGMVRDPRPVIFASTPYVQEYGVDRWRKPMRAHEANPLLVAFRVSNLTPSQFAENLAGGTPDSAHALRVLERLAVFS